MAVAITYPNNKSLVGPRLKPVADIVLVGPIGRFSISAVVVDTGADYLMVPLSAAKRIGWITAHSGSTVTVSTASGSTTMTLLPAVTLEVEGIVILAEVLCDPRNGSPLLGRSALRALANVGFNTTDWLW